MMFARWPGEFIQLRKIACGPPRYELPKAMFSPIVPPCQPAARNVAVNGAPQGVCVNWPHAAMRRSFSAAARRRTRLGRSAGRPARRRAWLIRRRMVARSPEAEAAVTVRGAAFEAEWSTAAGAGAAARLRENAATVAAEGIFFHMLFMTAHPARHSSAGRPIGRTAFPPIGGSAAVLRTDMRRQPAG